MRSESFSENSIKYRRCRYRKCESFPHTHSRALMYVLSMFFSFEESPVSLYLLYLYISCISISPVSLYLLYLHRRYLIGFPEKFSERIICIMSHRPYSLDLAPCDYWLNDYIKHNLTDQPDEKSLARAVESKIMKKIPKEEF